MRCGLGEGLDASSARQRREGFYRLSYAKPFAERILAAQHVSVAPFPFLRRMENEE